MTTNNVIVWQKACYVLQEGDADTFAKLLEATQWENYGTESGNPKCANCMVHSGYEASAVNDTFSSLRGLWNTARATFSSSYRDTAALAMLEEPARPVHAYNPLVQIHSPSNPCEETRA